MSDDTNGQVSEVSRLDPADADTPISDDQYVSGNPDAEPDEADPGQAGPNSKPSEDKSGR